MTNYSRSVLKSNGLRRPKIRLKKFGFSLKTFLANIVKKLPPQRCSKPLFIPIFNFSHKWPTFAFTGESGYTLGSRRKIAHNGTHGETGAVSDGGGITTLGAFRTFTNIPGPGIRTASFAAFGAWSGAPKERRKPSEQRCAHARRCSEASRPRWAAWSFFVSDEITACTPYSRNFFQFSRRSSLCCSCASCFSTRSFSARSCSRVFSFVIVLDPFS